MRPLTPDTLRAWRLANNHSQESLARVLGVGVGTVASWEVGRRGIPPYLKITLRGIRPRREKP